MPSCTALPTETTVPSGMARRCAAAIASSPSAPDWVMKAAAARVGARRHIAQEGRGEARVLLQMDDAGAVGADDSETVLRDERAQRRVARLAGVAGLGEAAGQDDEMTV